MTISPEYKGYLEKFCFNEKIVAAAPEGYCPRLVVAEKTANPSEKYSFLRYAREELAKGGCEYLVVPVNEGNYGLPPTEDQNWFIIYEKLEVPD